MNQFGKQRFLIAVSACVHIRMKLLSECTSPVVEFWTKASGMYTPDGENIHKKYHARPSVVN
jgi:hypothetical protein